MIVNRTVKKIVEQAMDLHHLTPGGLSQVVGCNDKSIYKLLDEQPCRLNQEQYFNLFSLAGVMKCSMK